MSHAQHTDVTWDSNAPEAPALDTAFAEFMAYKSDVADATAKAYRNDFANLRESIAKNLSIDPADLTVEHLKNKPVMWAAFGTRFKNTADSTRKRAWSTWNGLCEFLIDQGHLESNPMRSVRKKGPGTPTPPPKAIEAPDVYRLLTHLAMPDEGDPNLWRERDLALILSGLLLGLRTGDMISLNIGNFTARHDEPGAMTIQILGKGSKYRHATAEPELTQILEKYLTARAKMFPDTIPDGRKRNRNPWKRFDPDQPLFVGGDGERITRGTIQYRVKRAYARAGIIPSPGASAHRLRHTFAIQLAESGVPVHVLMNLLGHASMASTQKYLEASGAATREASRSNPLYAAIPRQT